jgi:hypothetical protein
MPSRPRHALLDSADCIVIADTEMYKRMLQNAPISRVS